MSYVKGTEVRITGRFNNDDTGALEDPEDVFISIETPSGETSRHAFSDDDSIVTRVGEGIFSSKIQLTEAGQWHYDFGATGGGAVVVSRALRVTESIVVEP